MHPAPLAAWHEAIARNDLTPFEAFLAEDAVFQSPAIHKPQAGKERVALYLRGAMQVLNNGTFRYAEEWVSPRSAVLEFEARVDGLDLNGVDILRWNDAGLVTSFKVMVRPYKGLTALMAQMAKLLEQAKA
jgi:ketosteroid isomerase-like protein